MGTDRRAYDLEWLNQPGPSTSNSPINDPLASSGRKSLPHDTGGRTTALTGHCFGKVIEFIPYLNCYRVSIENGPVLPCTAMVQQSSLPWGPSTTIVYGPGQDVIVLLRSSIAYGVIIGAVPSPVSSPQDWRPDAIFSGSNVGYFLDGTSNFWTGDDRNDLIDFSAGRPYDSTSSPEVSSQGITGVGVFHDDYMAALKADEETGVFVFYDDSMTRLAGRNLQIRATGLEEEHLNDEGELDSYRGRTPYEWESMGAYKPGVKVMYSVFEQQQQQQQQDDPEDNPEDDSEDAQTQEEEAPPEGNPGDSPEISGIRYGFEQPTSYDQQPFHRTAEYEGYLGQGGRKSVIIPGGDIEGKEDEIINTYSEQTKWQTLLSEQNTFAGSKVTAASGDILFVKRPPQPTPKRQERPESPLGDRGSQIDELKKNYDPCGLPPADAEVDLGGDKATHLVVAEVPLKDEEESVPPEDGSVDPAALAKLDIPEEVLRASLISDEIAYAIAWEGVHPFHYHKKDFYLPQESDLDEFNKSPVPPYESLSKYQFMGQDPEGEYPENISVKVDHRYGEVKIILNTAFFGLRRDGSFVLRTGCGCEVKSENGTLEFAAPGDIRMRPGRNLVVLAGNDAIVKARNSIDLSTSEGDFRAVAAKNWMAASAVDGDGVMLLQSFSPCILDPEKENTQERDDSNADPTVAPTDPEEPVPEDPSEPTQDPNEPEPPAEPKVTYFLGEEVIGSGILLKATKAQVTTCSQEATIKVGRKKYDDEDEEDADEPVPTDPETGEEEEKPWSWKPGKIRFFAEFGQVETMGTYIVDYVNDPGTFDSEGFEDSPETSSGAAMQVFLKRKNPPTDESEIPLEPNDLPENILAAAGVADLSSDNSCSEIESAVCYQVVSINEFRADRSTICSSLLVNHELFVGGCEYVRGNLTVFDHIESNFELQSFDGGLLNQRPDVVAVFAEADTRCIQLLPSLMVEQVGKFTATIDGSWLDFSWRTLEQYGTKDNFCLMETWWQHQVRIAAEKKAGDNPDPNNPPPDDGASEGDFNFYPDLPKGIVYWTETYTISHYANNEKTSPYPGIDYVFYDDKEDDSGDSGNSGEDPEDPESSSPRLAARCYGVYDLALVDEETGRPKDRSLIPEGQEEADDPLNIYEDAKLSRGAKRELDHYLAIDIDKDEEDAPEEDDDDAN